MRVVIFLVWLVCDRSTDLTCGGENQSLSCETFLFDRIHLVNMSLLRSALEQS
jgi:hypothetical protein